MKRAPDEGMTLVELLVVIVLISLLAGVIYKGVIAQGDSAKAEINVVRMEKVKSALGQYRLKYNTYPSQLQDLVSASPDIRKAGKLFTPLVDEDDLKDVWGFPYMYRSDNDGRSYALVTFGSDGIDGGEGPKQDVTMTP